ncbi:MAG: SH3 domain-containing protein [Micropepsaceae bacterium]
MRPVAPAVQEAALRPQSRLKVPPPPMVASGLPVPRWVTIKAGRVNVRRGPSMEQDILWTYVKSGMPIEVIAEYDTWRRIRDADGRTGWVKSAMLDGRRNVLIRGQLNAELRSVPEDEGRTVAYAAPGLVAELVSCAGAWCEITSRGYDGYVRRDRLWGVYPHETIR